MTDSNQSDIKIINSMGGAPAPIFFFLDEYKKYLQSNPYLEWCFLGVVINIILLIGGFTLLTIHYTLFAVLCFALAGLATFLCVMNAGAASKKISRNNYLAQQGEREISKNQYSMVKDLKEQHSLIQHYIQNRQNKEFLTKRDFLEICLLYANITGSEKERDEELQRDELIQRVLQDT